MACFGITYKADVEDLRESPSLEIVKLLAERDGMNVVVCDPMVQEPPEELRGIANISYQTIDQAIEKADIVAFLVSHRDFLELHPNRFLNKVVVDAIGLLTKPKG